MKQSFETSELDAIIWGRDNNIDYPKTGDKITFYGVPKFYYPFFTKMRKDAEDNLEVDREYTVLKCYVNSSWVTIYLEEFPELMFNLTFFKKQSGKTPLMDLIRKNRLSQV